MRWQEKKEYHFLNSNVTDNRGNKVDIELHFFKL